MSVARRATSTRPWNRKPSALGSTHMNFDHGGMGQEVVLSVTPTGDFTIRVASES